MGYNTKKSIKFSIMPFVFASAIILVLIYSVGFENFFRVIAYASPVGLISAVFIYSISWILRAVRLESLCKNVGAHVGIKELFKIYISGNALNVILPAKLAGRRSRNGVSQDAWHLNRNVCGHHSSVSNS